MGRGSPLQLARQKDLLKHGNLKCMQHAITDVMRSSSTLYASKENTNVYY